MPSVQNSSPPRHCLIATAMALTLAMVACGEAPSTPAKPDADKPLAPQVDTAKALAQAPVAAPVTATRDDVIAALRCHAVLSSAMANRIVVGGDGSAVVGVMEQTRWLVEAERRANAAGVPDSDFNALMATTRAPMITDAQKAENRPLLDRCLAELPPL